MKTNSRKILLIEDDLTLLSNVKEVLEEEGYKVKIETNGESGINSVFNWMPDLIVCDISMPQKSGYEVLETISKNKKTKRIPFIFLTAKVERDNLRKGMLLGADDYIFKPFDIDDLLTSCKIRLEKLNIFSNGDKQMSTSEKYDMDNQIPVRIGNKLLLYRIKDLKCISAKNPYALLTFADNKNTLQRQSLNQWEKKLPDRFFIRIHRTTIINSEYIEKIEKLNGGPYIVKLKNNEEPFVISKRYYSKFKNSLTINQF